MREFNKKKHRKNRIPLSTEHSLLKFAWIGVTSLSILTIKTHYTYEI